MGYGIGGWGMGLKKNTKKFGDSNMGLFFIIMMGEEARPNNNGCM